MRHALNLHRMRYIHFLFAAFIGSATSAQYAFDHAVLDDLVHREAEAHRSLPLRSDRDAVRGFDMKYLRCAWSLDPTVRAIGGSVTSYFTTTQDVDQIVFDLSDSLNADSAIMHQQSLTLNHAGNLLNIHLLSVIPSGQTDSMTVYYHGVPTSSGFGSFETGIHGTDSIPVLWTLSEPYGALEWWPCKQDLNDKIDSLDTYVTTPNAYRAAGNGLLIEETVNGARTTYHWRHRHPIDTYLIATAVTNYAVINDSCILPGVTVPMLTYAYPENAFMAGLNSHDVTLQQMPLYSQLVGNYPFADEKYGHAQFGWGGGMEHQTMTFVGGYSYELSAHELAHQWFGDRVTCGSWQDIWLNEGFATYFQSLCYNYLAPQYWHSQLRGRIDQVISQPGGSVFCTDTTSVNRIFDGRLSYLKASLVLHMLRWVCGDTAFFHGLRNYLNDPALSYGTARTSDLQAHLEATSGLDLTGFLADWFYGQGYPTYTLTWSQNSGGDVSVLLLQSPSHPSVSFFEMPVPVRFKNNNTDSMVVLNNTFNGQSFSFHLPFQADSALFDPDLWLISGANDIALRVAEVAQDADQVIAFPDPAQDMITLRGSGTWNGPTEVALTDDLGRVVMRTSLTSMSDARLSIAQLASGCYTITAHAKDRETRTRFVKE